MNWILENWVWVAFFAGFVALHLFGHGGHRRHGAPTGHEYNKRIGEKSVINSDNSGIPTRRSRRHH